MNNPKHLEEYDRFKSLHPAALSLIARSARLTMAAGRRPTIRQIWEELRVVYGIRANDHVHAYASREVMERYPDLNGVFRTRERQPKNDNSKGQPKNDNSKKPRRKKT